MRHRGRGHLSPHDQAEAAYGAEELLVAGRHYFTVNGPLPAIRESESAPSARVREMIETSAKQERVGVGD